MSNTQHSGRFTDTLSNNVSKLADNVGKFANKSGKNVSKLADNIRKYDNGTKKFTKPINKQSKQDVSQYYFTESRLIQRLLA
jgi:phage-related minor tail protein